MDSPTTKTQLTPIKRLGLSRRRSTPRSPLAALSLEKLETISTQLTSTPNHVLYAVTAVPKPVETEKTENNRLEELNAKLSALNDTAELQDAITTWKTGCKNALLDLKDWLSTEEGVTISCCQLVEKLGISSVIFDNFQDDSEVFDE